MNIIGSTSSSPSLLSSTSVATFLFLLLIGVSFVASAEGSSSGQRILFAGDSDIDYWKNTDKLYPNSVNKGDAGSTCKQWRKRIDGVLDKFGPVDTTVLVCGENDMWDRKPDKVFEDFQAIVKKINAAGSRVIYMGTKPEPDTKSIHNLYRQYDALIRNYYDDTPEKFVMVDVYPSFETLGNPKSLYAKDKLHLSNKGYSYWNKWLQSALTTSNGDCVRWQDGNCADDGGDDDNDDNNFPTMFPSEFSTEFPTEAPSSFCVDDKKFRYKRKRKRNCDWVGSKPKKLCKKRYKGKKLWEYCPLSCGKC